MSKNDVFDYSNKELIIDIASFIKPYKRTFFLGSFCRATSDLVWLFPVWALSEIITFTANYQLGASTTYAWQLLIAIAIVAIYHFIFHDIAKYLIYQIAEKARLAATKKTLRHLFDLDLQWHEQENSGNKMQRIMNGGVSIDNIIRMYVDSVIESSINLVAILIILTSLHWGFALMLIFFFVSYYVLSLKLTDQVVKQSHLTNLEWESFSGLAFESINNISIMKSLRIADRIFPFIEKISRSLFEKIRLRIFYFRLRSGVLNIYQEFFRVLLLAFTMWQIFNGQLAVGVLALVLLYFKKIEEASFEFAETYNKFVTAKIAILRMKEILRTEPEVENSGNKDFNPNWAQMEFKNVSFSYQGQKILHDFSLSIRKGEKIGIVGISGTGKSTLFKLALKLYNNYQGEILFDEQRLRDIRRESYMQKIAVVPQETELFNLSLEENITLSRRKKDKALLQKAMEIAHVKDFTYKLPEGVQSLVGEKGIKLSGGEKQRVGIARAIYQSPEILLLDEATSHLDLQSEQKIQDALQSFFANITAIVIAHRLSTIMKMDRIVVMDEGRVIEIGSFAELIARQGAFYQLWEKQKF